MAEKIVSVKNVKVYFPIENSIIKFSPKKNYVKAVDGVSFDIYHKEVFSIVGESGCGKTSVAKAMVSLVKPFEGEIVYDSVQMYAKNEQLKLRKKVQYVFQDPYSSLNPRMTVQEIIERPIKIHHSHIGKTKERVSEIISMVGLSPENLRRYPHEFSGGQKQRISIARALAVEPEFIIADEPTASLDVSIQAQIINLLMDLKEKLGLTLLFVSHDLGLVRHISDRVAVMYLGKIVEIGDAEEIFKDALHPYTKALLSAVPKPPNENASPRIVLKGMIPSSIDPPKGCSLHPRCPFAISACETDSPQLVKVSDKREVACFRVRA